MGRGSTFICKTCKIYTYLGYQAYSNWNDMVFSLDEFIEKLPSTDPLLQCEENQKLLRLLVLHHEHDISYMTEDWHSLDKNKDLWMDGAFGEPWFCFSMADFKDISEDNEQKGA